LVPDDREHVLGIRAIVDRERFVQTDPLGVGAQQPRADAMESSGPGQRCHTRRRPIRRARD
jgi:hypothetical protein